MKIVCLECGVEFDASNGEVCPNAPHPKEGEDGYVLPMYHPDRVDPEAVQEADSEPLTESIS